MEGEVENTIDVPAFFARSRRGGSPPTEELHARTSSVKRFNNGQSSSYGLRKTQQGLRSTTVSGTPVAQHSTYSQEDTILATKSHNVVRAGTVPASVISHASSAKRCSGKVFSHGWAFLCADGSLFAWEQGMVSAERAAAAVGADQTFLRFDHPTLEDELEEMRPLEVPVEASDLAALSQPWELAGGKRELLMISPAGVARYWPDLHSPRKFTDVDLRKEVLPNGQLVTRVSSLGMKDFACGLTSGGILRVRPGVARPHLLAETSTMISASLGFVKNIGSYLLHGGTSTPASAPSGGGEHDSTAPVAPQADGPGHYPVVGLTSVMCRLPFDFKIFGNGSASGGGSGGQAPITASNRIICLTRQTLEVWRVDARAGKGSRGASGAGEEVGSGAHGVAGTEALEARCDLVSYVHATLGVAKVCLLDLALTRVFPSGGVSAEDDPSHGENLEVLVLAVDMDEARQRSSRFSLHLVRVSADDGWGRNHVTVKLVSSRRLCGGPSTTPRMLSLPRATLLMDNDAFYFKGGVKMPQDAAADGPSPESIQGKDLFVGPDDGVCLQAVDRRCAHDHHREGDRVAASTGASHVSGRSCTRATMSTKAHVLWPSRGTGLGGDGGRWGRGGGGSFEAMGGGDATGAWVTSVCLRKVGELAEWRESASLEISCLTMFGGCAGGGPALRGCPGLLLLSPHGQALWVSSQRADDDRSSWDPFLAAEDGGFRSGEGGNGSPGTRAMETESGMSSATAVQSLKLTILKGLEVFENGGDMDRAGAAMKGFMLERICSCSPVSHDGEGDEGGGRVGARRVLDAAVTQAGLEVLNAGWTHPAAFSSPAQLAHLALREKARRHRALVRFLLDCGAWGCAASGRSALAECGEKIAAAARFCELQDATARDPAGVKAAELLTECVVIALEARRSGAAANGMLVSERSSESVSVIRDVYLQHTDGILEALVELHDIRTDQDDARSSSTLLQQKLADKTLGLEERIALLNHVSLVVTGMFEAAIRHRTSERSLYNTRVRHKVWTASEQARVILFRQLEACAHAAKTMGHVQEAKGRAENELLCGVIGRLSVLLLDGYKEQNQTDPVVSGMQEWQAAYDSAKALAVGAANACGREDLARSLADQHEFLEGIVSLCHAAEMRQPGCESGHQLLRSRMRTSRSTPAWRRENQGFGGTGEGGQGDDGDAEDVRFARFVLEWHLRRNLKTALLDIGGAVPEILRQFLGEMRQSELLWIFELRCQNYPGACESLFFGTPSPDTKGDRCRSQHLWTSLAKLANLAGEVGSEEKDADVFPAIPLNHARACKIQQQLLLAETREGLQDFLAPEAVVPGETWTWERALVRAVDLLHTYSSRSSMEDIEEAAHIALQGYKALLAGVDGGSSKRAEEFWREVVQITVNDAAVAEAVQRSCASCSKEGTTEGPSAVTDREMEGIWKRPTVLHLLLRAIEKHRRRCNDIAWAGGFTGVEGAPVSSVSAAKIHLSDVSVEEMVREVMQGSEGAETGSATHALRVAWVDAIRKCPP